MKYAEAKTDEEGVWDAVEPEEWEAACEYAGIRYHDYDDPDELWDDLTKKLKEVGKGAHEEND